MAGLAGGYDARGNLTFDGVRSFTYDSENRLITASGPATASLTYDPLGRLDQTVINGVTTQFLYPGSALCAWAGVDAGQDDAGRAGGLGRVRISR